MRRLLHRTVILSLLVVSLPQATYADLITTESALLAEQRAASTARVTEFLLRSEVQAELVKHGVAPEQAIERVHALTLSELQQLEGRIQSAPAGGIAEVIGVVFIVLIVLELVGVTNVFTNF